MAEPSKQRVYFANKVNDPTAKAGGLKEHETNDATSS